jgi:hypothetical protein
MVSLKKEIGRLYLKAIGEYSDNPMEWMNNLFVQQLVQDFFSINTGWICIGVNDLFSHLNIIVFQNILFHNWNLASIFIY